MSPMRIDRRSALKGLAAGTAALAVPRVFDPAAAAAPAAKGIFGYGVASGDPTGTSVVLWTRATPPSPPGQPVAAPGSGLGKPLQVRWEVARDEDFRHVVARGIERTSADSDHTVKVDVTGLQPYTRYHYRFESRGERSPVGHTRTAPDVPGEVHALRFALVSCSNYTGGYFTAYRAIAQRDDLDLVLHVGDYIYEYGNGAGRYGRRARRRARRPARRPRRSTSRATGCGTRCTRPTPTRRRPTAPCRGSRSSTTTRWPTTRGPTGPRTTRPTRGAYLERRAQAMQAYLEWMPFRMPDQSVPHQGTRFFKRFTFGALGDLSILETRQNRSQQVRRARSVPFDGFVPIGVNPAIDGAIASPRAATCPSREQMTWLKDGVAAAGSAVAPARQPGDGRPGALPRSGPRAPGPHLRQRRPVGRLRRRPGRACVGHLAAQPGAAGDVVVLTGDIHASFSCDLPVAATPGSPHVHLGGRRVRLPVGDERRLLRGAAWHRPARRPAARGGRRRDPAGDRRRPAAQPVAEVHRRRQPRLRRHRRDARAGAGRLPPHAGADQRPPDPRVEPSRSCRTYARSLQTLAGTHRLSHGIRAGGAAQRPARLTRPSLTRPG